MNAHTEHSSGSKTVIAMHAAPADAATSAWQPHSAFVPVLLFGLAVLAVLLWQTWVLATERSTLNTSFDAQQQTVDNAGKLRTSLDGLAADTQRLADRGNPNAALLVAELKKRGITINPQATAAAAAAAPAAPPAATSR